MLPPLLLLLRLLLHGSRAAYPCYHGPTNMHLPLQSSCAAMWQVCMDVIGSMVHAQGPVLQGCLWHNRTGIMQLLVPDPMMHVLAVSAALPI